MTTAIKMVQEEPLDCFNMKKLLIILMFMLPACAFSQIDSLEYRYKQKLISLAQYAKGLSDRLAVQIAAKQDSLGYTPYDSTNPAGYITAAIATATYSVLAHTHTFASLTSKPTTIAGYGIVDAFTQTAADALYSVLAHTHTFASLTSKPTTIAGYGIVDAFTQAAADGLYAVLAHTHTFASLTSKPTTLAGYGITDAVTANAPITGATKMKITYGTNGLVTAGANAATIDLSDVTVWTDYSGSTTLGGFSSTTTLNVRYKYTSSDVMLVAWYIAGTSNATTFSFTLPASVNAAIPTQGGIHHSLNNTTTQGMASSVISASGSTVNLFLGNNITTNTWTSGGTKLCYGQLTLYM
jgi:hypothetical protein